MDVNLAQLDFIKIDHKNPSLVIFNNRIVSYHRRGWKICLRVIVFVCHIFTTAVDATARVAWIYSWMRANIVIGLGQHTVILVRP